MLLGTGKWEWIGHARMRQVEDTFETGLQDGTLVRVRVKTEIVVTPISGTQPVTSHSLSPTKPEVKEMTTDRNRFKDLRKIVGWGKEKRHPVEDAFDVCNDLHRPAVYP